MGIMEKKMEATMAISYWGCRIGAKLLDGDPQANVAQSSPGRLAGR